MQFNFDLISDLHVETWGDFDWSGQPTSPYCIVAGDISQDISLTKKTLQHLSDCYQGGVFYIDGNDEHRLMLDNLGESYRNLNQTLKDIKNLVYLQNNVVIINGLAILATNGWWGFDFNSDISYEQSYQWYCEKNNVTTSTADSIVGVSYHDAAYLINSIHKLQTHQDVKAIVIVTHTLPTEELIRHDIDLCNSLRFNSMGNKHMMLALNEDTENKIKVWCFGHYHRLIDRDLRGIRFTNNCKGRGNTPWSQNVYFPKRIEINY